MKLLLVDDQPGNIRVLAEALAGYELCFATSPAQAIELASVGGVDLILLDVMMPGLDGFEVCRRLKSDPRTALVPVIFVTALGDAGDEARGFDAGGVDYITKPISPAIVRARVKTHLELKRQNEILRENVRLKEEVERISRHDLKTPLNSILSFAELLADHPRLDEEQRAAVETIERAGYRMLEMINRSLDLVKMEQGTYRLAPVRVELREIAERVTLDLGALAAAKQVRCEVTGEAAARGEELLTYSMLANVIRNAIEASPAKAVVFVDIDDDATVCVRNRGAVPASLRERFFEKYATDKQGGTGLGTYSARLMAETQGGSVSLDASDEETAVTIRLPRASEEDTQPGVTRRGGQAISPDQDRRNRLSSTRVRVLIADDDAATRLAMRRFLSRSNWTVDEAENGEAAAAKFAEAKYDFVFMDLEMPVMSGLEAAPRMRVRKGDAVIVALSSHDDAQTRERALAAGYDFYLIKPATRQTLLDVIQRGVVRLDPEIAEIVPQFLEGKREEIVGLRNASAEALLSASHRLKGSFKLYGFDEAARLCAALEQQASDAEGVSRLLDDLTRHLDTMRIEYAG